MRIDFSGVVPLSSEPFPWTDAQKEWLKALRSGEYKQGQAFLKDRDGAYCCLGVYAEKLGAVAYVPETIGGCSPSHGAYAFRMPDHPPKGYAGTGTLPYHIWQLSGLNDELGKFKRLVQFPGVKYGDVSDFVHDGVGEGGHTSLASMNDVRMIHEDGKAEPRAFTFEEIADYIERDPWNVFRE